MHNPCYDFWSLENGNHNGDCCCNCNYQRPITAHPWNKSSLAYGRITQIIGFGCASPEFFPDITFFESEHGMCECWTARDWPDPTKEQVWQIISEPIKIQS